jgi:hypothetical protein
MKIAYHAGMLFSFAAGLGFEPRYWASKAHVLPLDDPAITKDFNTEFHLFQMNLDSGRFVHSLGFQPLFCVKIRV